MSPRSFTATMSSPGCLNATLKKERPTLPKPLMAIRVVLVSDIQCHYARNLRLRKQALQEPHYLRLHQRKAFIENHFELFKTKGERYRVTVGRRFQNGGRGITLQAASQLHSGENNPLFRFLKRGDFRTEHYADKRIIKNIRRRESRSADETLAKFAHTLWDRFSENRHGKHDCKRERERKRPFGRMVLKRACRMKRSLSPRVALRFWFRFRLLQAGQQRSYQKRLLPFHPILLPALRPELVLALCFALIRFNQERKERVFLYVPGLSDHLAPDLPLPREAGRVIVGEPRFPSRCRR